MPAPAILFDLDGTLVDTVQDIADSANFVLAARGLPARPTEAFPPWIGEGVSQLMLRAAGLAPEADATELVREFRARYADHMLDRSRPYPGVEMLLAELVVRRVPMAVLSNKPHPATVEIVAHLFPDVPFAEVHGHRPELPHKPDPTSALGIAGRMGVPPASFLFVGDTEVDLATARAAGMRPVAVAWGFRPPRILHEAGAEVVLDAPSDLIPLL